MTTSQLVLTRRPFGAMPDGQPVHEYTLVNGSGLSLNVLTLGGIVSRLDLSDATGHSTNVVLGFDHLDDYLHRNPFFGVIVGRYANRIAQGRFEIDGQVHQLACNQGANCLHGGAMGFGTRLWQAEPAVPAPDEAVALVLKRISEDGEEGFPGRLHITVRYSLGLERRWRIEYEARCDRPTVVNLTHHSYFNLAGQGSALGHELTIPAQRYTEVDATMIPLQHATVAGTPFDFRTPRVVDERIRQAHPQLVRARGYDHNWVLDAPFDGALHWAATLRDPASGRSLEVHSTEPAIQFYSGNSLDAGLAGTGGRVYRQGDGICLETQHNPDSPNRPVSADWPSTVLRPGQVYRSVTEHRFN
ncbi:aldose epimerase family protein [Aquabacterium sp. OR-4]|uniref:aldose epimerase family protein n=1 Tax=Aquabacterium sp. OR-4 TaxID=2978127 RepID=UPI0028C70B3C|nr:aldose epimerase family protein [Aquabacterium sp. OR-4]MDT7838584.1 aldose epimerase family protein [Aquabacterium sp. OR-4]